MLQLPILTVLAVLAAAPQPADELPTPQVIDDRVVKSPEQASDTMLADAVRTELVLTRHVPAGHIEVEVDEGIVTLKGESPTLLGKERAQQVVGHLRGVRGIINQLTVARTSLPDGHVRTAVEAALAVDPATELLEISVSADDGEVTLTGTVDSHAEKQIASTVARSIVGVREVHNKLDVQVPAARPDAEIQADVEQRLHWDARIGHELINVAVNDGVVQLSGQVGSVFERDMALTRAWVAGARRVVAENLAVAPVAKGMRRVSAAIPADSAIRVAVMDTLDADPRVARFRPGVEVEHGVVTLTGVVDNVKARNAAAQDASNTFGVVAVNNLLTVKPRAPLSDDDLDRYVSIALDRDVFVTDQPIDVAVDDAVVTLSGTVESHFERSHAEDVASRMVGVREIENELKVTHPVPRIAYDFFDWDPAIEHYAFDRLLVNRLPDSTIRRNILRELYWSPYIDSGEIAVFVDNGVATLTGIVPSRFAVRDAVQSAYAGGAVAVRERLRVQDTAPQPVAESR